MKFIHTSDWHLGALLYGYDRLDEQSQMLDEVIRMTVENDVDALIVSGDVFNTAQPSTAAQRLLASKLTYLRSRMPRLAVIVTSGNHDSATRHEALAPVWDEAGIRMIGTFRADDSFGHNIIELPGVGFVAAVPYVNGRFMAPDAYSRLLDAVEARNTEGLPVVLMAHLTVAGADWSAHDRYDNFVGGIEICPLERMGCGYDYLALGHIHNAQKISDRARYSGSPLAMSFSEPSDHSVCLVEIGRHGELPTVELLPVRADKPLLTLPETGAASWKDALKMLKGFPADRSCYLRLNVVHDGTVPPDWRTLAADACRDKASDFCTMTTVREKTSDGGDDAGSMTFEKMRSISPMELASLYLRSQDLEMSDDMAAVFRETLADVERENRGL